MRTIRTLSLAAGLSLAGSIAASAATLDFTDLKTFTTGGATATSSQATGTIGSGASAVNWTLKPGPIGAPLRYNFDESLGLPLGGEDDGFDGDDKAALQAQSGLKLDGDGLGVVRFGSSSRDEITFGEWITITFDKAISVTGIHVLDLFFGTHEGVFGREIADVSGDLVTSLTANQRKQLFPNDGYRFGSVDSNGFTVTTLTFRASATNQFGDDGVRDYALAAIDYELAPIPVPAGGILLLTAMAGLAAVRRRKQA